MDKGFKSLWRRSVGVAFRNPAGCSAQILWSSSLAKYGVRQPPIFACRTSREQHHDRSNKSFNLTHGDGQLVEYARESTRGRLGWEMMKVARN